MGQFRRSFIQSKAVVFLSLMLWDTVILHEKKKKTYDTILRAYFAHSSMSSSEWSEAL